MEGTGGCHKTGFQCFEVVLWKEKWLVQFALWWFSNSLEIEGQQKLLAWGLEEEHKLTGWIE